MSTEASKDSTRICGFEGSHFDNCKIVVNVTNIRNNYGGVHDRPTNLESETSGSAAGEAEEVSGEVAVPSNPSEGSAKDSGSASSEGGSGETDSDSDESDSEYY